LDNLFNNDNNNTNNKTNLSKSEIERQIVQQNIMKVAKKKYPELTNTINTINDKLCSRQLAPELEDLIKKKFNSNCKRPPKLPHFAKCLLETNDMLGLNDKNTMQGIAARFVATETLKFLIDIIKSIHGRLINHIPNDYHYKVKNLVNNSEKVTNEFRTYMYRNVPTLVLNLGQRNDNNSNNVTYIKNKLES